MAPQGRNEPGHDWAGCIEVRRWARRRCLLDRCRKCGALRLTDIRSGKRLYSSGGSPLEFQARGSAPPCHPREGPDAGLDYPLTRILGGDADYEVGKAFEGL